MDKEVFDIKKELEVLGDFTTISSVPQPVPYVYGKTVVELMKRDERIVCLCADVQWPTENDYIRKHFPERYYQMGIAEANMIGVASGMAKTGDIVFAHTFAVFASRRALDQIAMQIAYPKAKVLIMGFLPGIATNLGVSHQSIKDIACFRSLPNMNIFEPYHENQLLPILNMALESPNPSYLRLKRFDKMYDSIDESIKIGEPQVLIDGEDLAIFATGMTVDIALEAAEKIKKLYNKKVTVVNVFSLKPINEKSFCKILNGHKNIISIENHSVIGGLGTIIAEILVDNELSVKLKKLGVQDVFAEGAETDYLFKKYGISTEAILKECENIF